MVCLRLTASALFALFSFIGIASAEEASAPVPQGMFEALQQAGIEIPPKDYIGWMPNHMGFTNVASAQVSAGVLSFYKAYERWPVSWTEVMAVGAWQTSLAGGFNGEAINPDDGKLDFAGDVYYDPTNFRIVSEHPAGAPGIVMNGQMSPVMTYRESFEKMYESGAPDIELNRWTGTPEQRSYFATLGSIKQMAQFYYTLHQRMPQTYAEFVATRFGPVDATSINPLTGRPFAGDGSPLDLSYRVHAEHPSAITITHVLPNGKRPRVIFSF